MPPGGGHASGWRLVARHGADGANWCPAIYTYDGQAQNNHFGRSVAGVGDVNNDGCDDFLVGSPSFKSLDGVSPGKVHLYSGATGALIRSWIMGRNRQPMGGTLLADDSFEG